MLHQGAKPPGRRRNGAQTTASASAAHAGESERSGSVRDQPAPEPSQWLYRLFAHDGTLLYVGITRCVEERFAEHRKKRPWWPEVARHTVQTYASREDVELAERHAIYREKPLYNVVHNATGRRLYGPEPIPASEPLTPGAAKARTKARLREAFNGPARPTDPTVVRMADWRAKRASA